MSVTAWRKRVRRIVVRWRRPLAAILAGLSVLLLWSALRSPEGPREPLVVAARDIAAGTTLTAADLSTSSLPQAYLPPGALTDAGGAIGQITATALRAGEPVTDTRLANGTLRIERGLSAVPIRLADAGLGALLSPGLHIDVVAASEESSGRIIAADVRVVAVPRPGSLSTQQGTLVIVAAPRDEAVVLAATAASVPLSAILR